MARKLAVTFAVMSLVVLAVGFYAVAQETAPAPAGQAAGQTRSPEEMMTRYIERMKEGGASEGTIMRFKQMQLAKFSTDEPIGLLALKDEIKLDAEQVAKIQAIADSARAQAKAVLTPEQTAALDKLSGTPDTVMALNAETRGRMGGRRGE